MLKSREWFCPGHSVPPLEKPFFLKVPLELRQQINRYIYAPYGLIIGRKRRPLPALLLVNKQIYEESMGVIYGGKPLRLCLNDSKFRIDQSCLEGNRLDWGTNTERLFTRLLRTSALQYIQKVVIRIDLSQRKFLRTENFELFRAKSSPQISYTVKASGTMLTSQNGRVGFLRFLRESKSFLSDQNTEIELEAVLNEAYLRRVRVLLAKR